MGPRKHLGKLEGRMGLLNMMEQPPRGVPEPGAAGSMSGTKGSSDPPSPGSDAGPAQPGR